MPSSLLFGRRRGLRASEKQADASYRSVAPNRWGDYVRDPVAFLRRVSSKLRFRSLEESYAGKVVVRSAPGTPSALPGPLFANR